MVLSALKVSISFDSGPVFYFHAETGKTQGRQGVPACYSDTPFLISPIHDGLKKKNKHTNHFFVELNSFFKLTL
jgi:hypothetical protein